MQIILTRIVALLLIPCFMVDPVLAHAVSTKSVLRPRPLVSAPFTEQALAQAVQLGHPYLLLRKAGQGLRRIVKGLPRTPPPAAAATSESPSLHPPWLGVWQEEIQRLLDQGKSFSEAVSSTVESTSIFPKEATTSLRSNRWFVLAESGSELTIYYRSDSRSWRRWPVTCKENKVFIGKASAWPDTERAAFERLLAAWQSVRSNHDWIAYSSRQSRLSNLANGLLVHDPALDYEQIKQVWDLGRDLEKLDDSLSTVSEELAGALESRIVNHGVLVQARDLLADMPSRFQTFQQRLAQLPESSKWVKELAPRGQKWLTEALPFYDALRQLVTGEENLEPHRLQEALSPIETDLAELNVQGKRWSDAATASANALVDQSVSSFLRQLDAFAAYMDQGVIREGWLGKKPAKLLRLDWLDKELVESTWCSGAPGIIGLMVQEVLLGAIARGQATMSESAHVVFQASRRGDQLILLVTDNGQEQDRELLVSPTVSYIAKLLGAQLEFRSTASEGNAVTITLPLPRPPFLIKSSVSGTGITAPAAGDLVSEPRSESNAPDERAEKHDRRPNLISRLRFYARFFARPWELDERPEDLRVMDFSQGPWKLYRRVFEIAALLSLVPTVWFYVRMIRNGSFWGSLLGLHSVWRVAEIIVALIFMVVGYALCNWARRHLGDNFEYFGCSPGEVLKTSGPYRMIRHPIALGDILITSGIGLLLALYPAVPFSIGLFASAAWIDDVRLWEKFEDRFIAYAESTPRFFSPFLWFSRGRRHHDDPALKSETGLEGAA